MPHIRLFQDLGREFRPAEIKSRPQGGRQMRYVTARTVMNRLDEVLGPENWWDDYVPLEHSVICRLTVRLPDGMTVTKCDVGGNAGMADAGDDDKSGFSDAFKRAAVKFGVGRYLYGDGIPAVSTSPPAPSAPSPLVGEVPASAGDGGKRHPSREDRGPKAPRTKITTGPELHTWIRGQKIDPALETWVIRSFARYPSRIEIWTPAQIAEALPQIREHLAKIRTGKHEEAA